MLKKAKNRIGSNIIILKSIDSTNKFIKDNLNIIEFIDGTIVYSREQFAGKGQGVNTWESEPNKNLTISILLNPTFLLPENQFELSKVIALGVSDFIKLFVKKQVYIKWPNDIYVENHKIAGILIENIIQGNVLSQTIVGIGININQEKFLSNAPNPISLKNITGKEFDLLKLLNKLAICIEKRYALLKSKKNKILTEDYISALYRFNEFNNFEIKGNIVKAKILNVDKFGRLCLVDNENLKYVLDVKEIKFLNLPQC